MWTWLLAMPIAAVLTLVVVEPVVADDPINDDIDLGQLCQGLPWGDTETWMVRRTADGPQYPDGATLRLSLLGVDDPAVVTYAIALADDTIVLPPDWRDRPTDGTVTSFPDSWRYDYTLTGLTTGGSGVIDVTWGVSANDGPTEVYPSALSIQVGAPCPGVTPAPTADTAPRTIELRAILDVPAADRFETFGSGPIRLRSVWSPEDLGLGGTCADGDGWLECGLEDWLIQSSPDPDGAGLGIFFAPDVHDQLQAALHPGDGPLDVIGHFGDVASDACHPDARDACRDRFVVTAVTRKPAATMPATATSGPPTKPDEPSRPISVVVVVIATAAALGWGLAHRRTRGGDRDAAAPPRG